MNMTRRKTIHKENTMKTSTVLQITLLPQTQMAVTVSKSATEHFKKKSLDKEMGTPLWEIEFSSTIFK